jgi:prolyl-tRNA synthetase
MGTPLRIEVGPRDLASGIVKLVRRDTLQKYNVQLNMVGKKVSQLLKEIQSDMLKKAKQNLKNNIVYCNTYDQLKENVSKNKFVLAPFAGDKNAEKKIKQETLATTRCIPLSYPLQKKPENARCIITGKPTKRFVIFSLAY